MLTNNDTELVEERLSNNSEPRARFLRACQRLPVDATPVWFMRQAGRYMPEYRAIREKYSLLEIVARPDIAAEVTMQPVLAHGVDAAILFADILLPVEPMGLQLEFVKGEGPVIYNPVRSMEDVQELRKLEAADDLGHVMETIRLVRTELGKLATEVPLIGFSGAPFTVASYMIEGGPSRNYVHTKKMMYSAPAVWHAFMEKMVEALSNYLRAQVEAGAEAVQLFDSWVGALNPSDYERYVLPYSQKVLKAAANTGVPVIHFGTGTATLLPAMKRAGGTVIGLDWRVPLDLGWDMLGPDVAVQGNLDPVALYASQDVIKEKVEEVLIRAGDRPGHIFNLGHGIIKTTPVDNVKAVVDMVHEMTSK